MRPWLGRRPRPRPCGPQSASMGPRPCGRGWLHSPDRRRRDRRASMGPRPCGRGWIEAAMASIMLTPSFNGATALRPWLGPHSNKIMPLKACFNGATALRPWLGASTWRGSSTAARCFNGATALRPWLACQPRRAPRTRPASMGPRPCGRGWHLQRHRIECRAEASMGPRPCGRGWPARPWPSVCKKRASMGPRPCGRGWDLELDGERLRGKGFNGATALRPWLEGPMPGKGKMTDVLQWGHGLAAVVGEAARLLLENTWSLQWGHGLAAVVGEAARRNACAICGLQWGHGLAAVVGVKRGLRIADHSLLQWGHGLAAVVGSRGGWVDRFLFPASMGPRPCGRGWSIKSRLPLPVYGFNGATALRPWLAATGPATKRRAPGFNGATALRPWLARIPSPGCRRLGIASMGPRPCGRGWPVPSVA